MVLAGINERMHVSVIRPNNKDMLLLLWPWCQQKVPMVDTFMQEDIDDAMMTHALQARTRTHNQRVSFDFLTSQIKISIVVYYIP
jgi:hypothetical protein